MKREKKIIIATGTRADWGLLLPLARKLRERGADLTVAATYAHLFPEMGNTLEEIKADGFEPVEIGARMNSVEAVADTVTGFAELFRNERPDFAVILGDRFEMLGVATAALLTGVKIAHIAGGTVSTGAFDDSIRHSISKMAKLHFPETKKSRNRLLMMGEDPGEIMVAGALGVYNVLNEKLMSREELSQSLNFDLGDKFIVGTYHPATVSSISPAEQMKIWIEAMEETLKRTDDLKYLLTYPNSDTDPTVLISMMEDFRDRHPGRVFIYPSLGRIRYLSAAKAARAVIGNSSSGIVEVPSLGTPVLDIGDRQNGRERSKAVVHAALGKKEIEDGIYRVLTDEIRQKAKTTENPYYRKDTPDLMAERILKEI